MSAREDSFRLYRKEYAAALRVAADLADAYAEAGMDADSVANTLRRKSAECEGEQ